MYKTQNFHNSFFDGNWPIYETCKFAPCRIFPYIVWVLGLSFSNYHKQFYSTQDVRTWYNYNSCVYNSRFLLKIYTMERLPNWQYKETLSVHHAKEWVERRWDTLKPVFLQYCCWSHLISLCVITNLHPFPSNKLKHWCYFAYLI